MNPCFCGWLGDASGRCACTPDQVLRYRSKISGPLLDRIDLQLFVPRVEREALTAAPDPNAETSATVRDRVIAAHSRQLDRTGKPNARLTPKEIERACVLDTATKALLDAAMARMGLSARGYHRVLKVARTVADLAGAPAIAAAHLAEALRLRELDRATR